MEYKLSILVIEDMDDFRFVIKSFLTSLGYHVVPVKNLSEARLHLGNELFDLVLLDLNLPDGDGTQLIPEIKNSSPDVVIWIMSGNTNISRAISAMKLGVSDYLIKPIQLEELQNLIALLHSDISIRNELKTLRSKVSSLNETGLIFKSELMKDVITNTHYFAKAEKTTILITGETGTGKELIAEEIHQNSTRRNGPFIKINCSAIPENLLESELFGHEKGAFSDAHQTKHGLFEQANNGTLFLDEIGELSQSLQPKLLRVLESKSFRRVGGIQEINVNVRIVAATNRDLKAMVEKNNFRSDLYHRLNVLEIRIPPLRERPEDVLFLSHSFAASFGKELGVSAILTTEAEKILVLHCWEGNVRELRNVIERAVILSRGESITIKHLDTINQSTVKPEKNKKRRVSDFGLLHDEKILTLDEMNRQYIRHVLQLSDNNKSLAAKALDINRNTLRDKLDEEE